MQKGFSAILVLVGLVAVVVIAGGIFYANKLIPTAATPNYNQPLPSTQKSKVNETASMKTYISENYGYSFKYPTNFWITSVTTSKKTNSGTVASIGDAPPPPTNTVASLSITDIERKQNEGLDKLVDRYLTSRTEYKINTTENITINNHPSIYLKTFVSNTRYDLIFLDTGNSNVVIVNIHGANDSLQPTINNMLSTFKFAE